MSSKPKDPTTAAILTLILLYSGYLYIGLSKRWLIAIVLAIILSVILPFPIGLIINVYYAYDAYECTKAINSGAPLPKLFGFMEI